MKNMLNESNENVHTAEVKTCKLEDIAIKTSPTKTWIKKQKK
jgi:hypothetical protein